MTESKVDESSGPIKSGDPVYATADGKATKSMTRGEEVANHAVRAEVRARNKFVVLHHGHHAFAISVNAGALHEFRANELRKVIASLIDAERENAINDFCKSGAAKISESPAFLITTDADNDRRDLARECLANLIKTAPPEIARKITPSQIAIKAVNMADALIAELAKPKAQ